MIIPTTKIYNWINSPTGVRILPFVAFMSFIALEEGLRTLLSRQLLDFDVTLLYWLYFPKALCVGALLLLFWRKYIEVNWHDLRNLKTSAMSFGSGLLVFVLWINMDWTLGGQNPPPGFNPEVFDSELIKWLMIAIRITGAVIIVPIMEELFWRSFLLRYLINPDFMAVAIGRFTLFSFISVCLLFGLEHHYLFAGVMAGVVFNGIYYWTRSIVHCILSHAVANLGLAVYVLNNSQWRFW